MNTSSLNKTRHRPRLTKFDIALKNKLHEDGLPVITHYRLFITIRSLYNSDLNLRLRKRVPDKEDFDRRRRNLLECNVITPDADYPKRAYRLLDINDRPAEDVVCLVDPFCCISYLSAMARYGLTNRRPRTLHIKGPDRTLLRKWREQRMLQDYGDDFYNLDIDQFLKMRGISHPETVRNCLVISTNTRYVGYMMPLRDSFSRISSIGQTFADMLDKPHLCGGMSHVLEVWSEHADLYIDNIVQAIDQHPRPIVKIRAGYILDEIIGIGSHNNTIQGWTHYAQRGGSRVLDPEEEFDPHFSEKWMISINVR